MERAPRALLPESVLATCSATATESCALSKTRASTSTRFVSASWFVSHTIALVETAQPPPPPPGPWPPCVWHLSKAGTPTALHHTPPADGGRVATCTLWPLCANARCLATQDAREAIDTLGTNAGSVSNRDVPDIQVCSQKPSPMSALGCLVHSSGLPLSYCGLGSTDVSHDAVTTRRTCQSRVMQAMWSPRPTCRTASSTRTAWRSATPMLRWQTKRQRRCLCTGLCLPAATGRMGNAG